MGAPKQAMATTETKHNGFRKFFTRKSKPLQVGSPPPVDHTTDTTGSNSTNTKSLSAIAAATAGRGGGTPVKKKSNRRLLPWTRNKEQREEAEIEKDTETPVVEQSSGSSEDVEVLPGKFESRFETERIQSIRPIGGSSPKRTTAAGTTTTTTTSSTVNIESSSVKNYNHHNQEPRRISPLRGASEFKDVTTSEQVNGSAKSLGTAELSVLQAKQLIKERDGFCRRVDHYDGSVIRVEGQAAYELGNYLGGGVAGVVYEGHRLLPESAYPIRRGMENNKTPSVIETSNSMENRVDSLLSCVQICNEDITEPATKVVVPMTRNNESLLSEDSKEDGISMTNSLNTAAHTDTVALEAVGDIILVDSQDAPNRSKHQAKAVTEQSQRDCNFPSDASFTNGFMEETVAIKILNPVGFRTLAEDVTEKAVVAREGASISIDVIKGRAPLEEKHVWWLINPSSRNLRTLQRYSANDSPRGVEVDRGAPDRGLRISLIAAYKDPASRKLKELPLTRCIEIWGHVPFEATDLEFREVMSAIDKINQGLPPPAITPSRVMTETSSMVEEGSDSHRNFLLSQPTPMTSKRTGIYRAATTPRKTVYCAELQAYIALPAVPSKYLKWLRQRRAATKEIRNMMLIGRHRNVVHLFEVLELIQETKSTMFLILELVRGGELFDLISSNAAKISSKDVIPPGFTESETVMRKFFVELACGINYCHSNNIAHRDLKPENLLVHNGTDGHCTLKIADFGLSATFGPNAEMISDQDTAIESYTSGPPILKRASESVTPPAVATQVSPIKQQMDKLLNVGSTALGFLTCGAVEDIISCSPNIGSTFDVDAPSPLKRMTSIVGSPHYVAPEIISQNDRRSSKDAPGERGYDGTKADVWSAGVILYAMLFRSLPFGEDLLRCPRYQSYKKWYDDVKMRGGPRCRRNDIRAALNPVITELDKEEFLGPHWFFPSDSSPESRDLIVYMLNPDPDVRPSIQLVLQHPWLSKKHA